MQLPLTSATLSFCSADRIHRCLFTLPDPDATSANVRSSAIAGSPILPYVSTDSGTNSQAPPSGLALYFLICSFEC